MATPIINQASKKYAVIIGINYNNTASQLNGCINDANHIKQFLLEKCGYLIENIMMLTDDGKASTPTKQNIINSFETLVNKANNEQYTELWFSYSGHGSNVYDKVAIGENVEEIDGFDEVICPVDYESEGMIMDDFIYDNLVVKLPKTATLMAVMDCCYSGTIFDLPYIYNNSNISVNNANNRHVASVVSISGCRDDQLSADAYIGTNYEGAMTWSLLNVLANSNYYIKTIDLVNRMNTLLKSNNYTQVPLLAVSTNTEFDRLFMQSIVVPPPTTIPVITTKPINFTLTVDYWYKESKWNVWSFTDKKNVFPIDNVFIKKYEYVDITKKLAPGKYKLIVTDTYGDGGVTSLVLDGLVTLVYAKMSYGKLAEYTFNV